MSKKLLILSILFSVATSFAQTKRWDKEPETVFGIPLGEAIPAGLVPTCPPVGRENGYKQPTELCIEFSSGRYANEIAALNALPFRDIAHSSSIHFDDGRVSNILISLNHNGYDKMRQILVERYGEPTKIERSTVTSMAGASIDSERLSWVGVKNSVSLSERSDRIDRSLVVFSNNALTQSAEKKRKNAVKDAASKL